MQHVFRLCSVAKLAWNLCTLKIQPENDVHIVLNKWVQQHILLFYREDGKQSNKLAIFIAMLWSIWTTRNARVFRESGSHASMILQQAKLGMQQLEIFKKGNPRKGEENTNEHQNPPGFWLVQLGISKTDFANFVLQVDGSWDKNTTKAGYGWAFRKEDNMTYEKGGGTHGSAKSALQAEAQACLHGLQWAKLRHIANILILTECTTLVNSLQSKTSHDIHIHWTLEEIKRIAQRFNVCTIMKTNRLDVKEAHDITNSCRREGLSFSNTP
ncbi:uncharacterized protein [Spinacia oleracea]|uniref:RNase H type-1 domain-containing protein n=1 Tax=Spinacia oleracea TaxID=3562 RepID=A0ABM3RJ21_SPIOL|nr:uncharacterized protein LOC130470047 [Spinacia oleracea]